MTLTTIIGSSGSGKSMLLNDLYESWNQQCVYIRQHHTMRPYVILSQIPNFNPIHLPYWNTYVNEKKDLTIMAGGTMAGEITYGLSGGQRKLLLFEIIYQRVMENNNKSSNLLLLFDEPFAGVTDDYISHICTQLNEMKLRHNVILVTNDHIHDIMLITDNTIRVNSLDQTRVSINRHENISRDKTILLLSAGESYDGRRSFITNSTGSFDVEDNHNNRNNNNLNDSVHTNPNHNTIDQHIRTCHRTNRMDRTVY